jgi:hypothetical protein
MATFKPSTVATANGQTKTLADFAKDLGCPVQTVISRLKRGQPAETALAKPVGKTGGSNRGQKLAAEILTPEELQLVLEACNHGLTGQRNRALIVIGWRAGLRISEALSLKLGDLDQQQQTVRILHGKGNKSRTVGLDSGAWRVIQNWITERNGHGIKSNAPLFCTEEGKPVQDRYVRELLPRLATKAGINKRCHFHGLRHTMAFELASEGVPMHLIQQQLGHSNLSVTSRYISHLNPAETINRMKSRQWGQTKSIHPTTNQSPIPSPDWLTKLKHEIGDRLQLIHDARTSESDFKAIVLLF